MSKEGYDEGFGAAVTRLWHMTQNSMQAVKWNLIEILTTHESFDPDKIPLKRPGRVAIVTGGSRGIGANIVKKLLQADMKIFIGCRNIEMGNTTVKKWRDEGVKTGVAECVALDLTSLASVRKFAKTVLDANVPIHVLINNAGLMWVPYDVTPDGFESQFQVNYLSHFLLINLLLPRLASSGQNGQFSRIVNVSSIAQYGGEIVFDNLQMKKKYSCARAYQNSKLMQVISSNYMDAKFKSNNAKIASFAVHPGVIESDLYSSVFGFSVLKYIIRYIFKSTDQGADGVVFTALSPEVEGKGGLLFANCQKIPHTDQAIDTDIQQKLWDISCELTGLHKDHLNTALFPMMTMTEVTPITK